MKFTAKIFVTLRHSVLDPAGTAVKSALEQMHQEVESVRIGKYIEMIINATDQEIAIQQVNLACDRLLANPVIETYTFELISNESN
ncbi:phosphoribosylformylglycinamidine synthase, purS protein [Synechococcus sp. PCC 7502]|uniref:phosphoribosylformylglycinamidine synthase subunit PurS n=1 Tax=Synechococcus sp. PCC 7502 TaxID=1173263 RepID=UPI00029F85B4|nr:phosphoribosylformylglycinamidine synthase subunit PurS [Synechococcus sp. PCC 7502]AFY74593.1 phosphoribosylformylglycinamidine synthase, purS protein [Synechococcus sp. PCC 7502]